MQSSHIIKFDKIIKINDKKKAQKRVLQLRDDGIYAMNGKKVKRFVDYEDIIGVTYNLDDKVHEFVIHNPTGDLRYR